MNTTSKMVSLAMLCLAIHPRSKAQKNDQQQSAPSVMELQKKWFSVDDEDMHFRITVELNKGESMVLKFKSLSDWTSQEEFRNAFTGADKVMAVYKDSLRQEQSTKVLDVYIPANQKNMITRFNQVNESASLMTINADGVSALKAGMDTLRILQAKTNGAKLQYTFILKNLVNFNAYEQDENWKAETTSFVDSVVNDYRKKWKHPDAAHHSLMIKINPSSNTKSVFEPWTFGKSLLQTEASMGVSLVRNEFCPNVELGLGYYISRDHGNKTFIRLSGNGFYRFQELTTNHFKAYETSFVNLEFGSESNHDDPASFFYKTSIGFGYKLLAKNSEDRDPTMDKQMYRLFFTYSINKLFMVTPELVTNFHKGDAYNGWFGLSLNIKLF